MTFAVEGFATVAQNYISKQVASNFYRKATFLAILGALTLGNQSKTSLEIGRPGSGEILTAANVSQVERKRLGTVNNYLPRIQKFQTSNSKWMGVRDTMPSVASPTTLSQGQATQFAASFAWADLTTPMLIWHEDKIRAGQESTKEGQALAMGQLIDEATEVGMQEHIDEINSKTWTGNPSSQTAALWDQPLGINQALQAANVYANVDRAVEATWRAQVDSTITSVDINRIVDDANLTKELRVKGNGANCIITTVALYQQFKAQVLNTGGVVLQNGLPEMAKIGVKKEVLQKDNVYIAYDSQAAANSVQVFDLTTWKFMVHPSRNFSVSKWTDLSDKGEGAKDADQAFIRTRLMLTCDNPFLNVKYSAIGT
jgi:hypothetical protein